MSIPASVVLGGDLDTIGRLRSGRLDDPFMPSMDRPYGEGLLLMIPPHSNFGSITYTAPFNMELHRVHFDTTRYNVNDEWELYMNNNTENNYIIRKSYQKNYTEGLQLMSVIKLNKGDTLTFKLKSTDTSKGIKAEISMAFLISSKDKKGNGTSEGGTIDPSAGLHISYNVFGSEAGYKIPGTELYEESTPFYLKGNGDYFKYINMTGEHTDFKDSGKEVMSLIQNTSKTVKVFYEKPNGSIEVIQLKKNWMYVAVPLDIDLNNSLKSPYLKGIEDKFKEYGYFKNIPYRVRGIREEYLRKIVKITIT